LVYHRAIFAQIIFFDAVDFWGVDEKGISIAEDGASIRFTEIDAQLVVTPHEHIARFCGSVADDGGVFDVLNVGGQGMKTLRGFIHPS
jgi:hypothetical protein